MPIRSKKLYEFAFLAVLFCFSVSLFNLAGYIFSAMVLLMFLFVSHKLYLTSADLWLILFSVSYFFVYLFQFGADVETFILYFLGPWTAHIIGHQYIEQSRSKKSFIVLLVVLSLGMFLHGVLNIIAYLRSDYFSLYNYYRQSVDFWRGELVNVKSTEMLFTFGTGLGMGVLFTSYKTKYKVIAIIALILALSSAVFMANRAMLIIFASLLLWRLFCWYGDKRVSVKEKAIVFALILLIIFIAMTMVLLNIGGIADYIMELKIFQRFASKGELTRFDVWDVFWEDLRFLEFPFGGKKLTETAEWGYLHNMWLDVYNVVGVIPFIVIIICTVKFALSFSRFNKAMKTAKKENERVLFQSLVIAVFMNMLVEPIIEANPYFLLMVLMLFGAMETYTHKTYNEPLVVSSS